MADDEAAFPTLDESELAVLDSLGSRRSVDVGEFLYREGDESYDFYAIRSGAAEITVRDGDEERVIARHGPGRFLGELNLLTGMRVYVSARVVEPGEVTVGRPPRSGTSSQQGPDSATRSWRRSSQGVRCS